MKKKVLILMLILSVSAMSFLFAGGGQEKTVEPMAAQPQEFSWWALTGGGGVDDIRITFRENMIADFKATHPDVNVDLVMLENEAFKQKVQVAIQAGNPPDIFHSWGGGVMIEYAQAGMLKDITSTVKNDLSKRIGMGALGVYGFDGKYYGAPYDMGAVGLWYNKAILNEVGYSAAPKTWAELIDVVKKTKAAGYVPIALGGGDRWPAHFWWVYIATRLGGQDAFNKAYTGAGSFTDATFVKAGEMLLELEALNPFQEGYLGATYDNEAALVGNGQAAMELMGQWAPAVQASNSENGSGIGDDLGWAPFPSIQGGVGKLTDVMGGGNGYVIGKDAPDVAVEFLSFFLQEKYARELITVEGAIPTVKGIDDAFEGNAKAIVNAVSAAGYYQLYYDQFLPPAVGETIKDAVVALLARQATPLEAAQMIQDEWEMQ